jgi:hypothetical protein
MTSANGTSASQGWHHAEINRRDCRQVCDGGPRCLIMYLVKSLPFGSKVKVTNKKNGHAVTVTITDRGAYVKGRCVDLSKAGAGALDLPDLLLSVSCLW